MIEYLKTTWYKEDKLKNKVELVSYYTYLFSYWKIYFFTIDEGKRLNFADPLPHKANDPKMPTP